MDLKKHLGQNVKKYRKLSGLTQEQLAEIIGVEVISVSSIETGRYFPSPENLLKIAETLNIPLAYLFEFKSPKTHNDYVDEIISNIGFIKNDKTKLIAVSEFLKSLL